MRLISIALAVMAALFPFQSASAASSPATVGSQPPSAVMRDIWEHERTVANEAGFYPVPQFLRPAGVRPPTGSPHIAGERSSAGVAYPSARRRLIEQGFLPVTVISAGAEDRSCGRVCRAFPEVLRCTGAGVEHCAFLYRRRGSDRFWIISTIGEPPDFNQLRCCGYRPATESYLDNVVILRPDGRRFRFRYPPKAPKPDEAPLCSETGDRTPCWVKPPPAHAPQ